MTRIEEIKQRLKNVEGIINPDADDIYHDHHVGTGISEEMCELYGNAKSDIEYLLKEIEKRDQAIEILIEQRNRFIPDSFVRNNQDIEIEGLLK